MILRLWFQPGLLLTEHWVVYFAQVDVDCLLIGVEVDRAVATFLAKSGGLDTTEWGAQVANIVGIEPDHTGVNVMREVMGTLQVVGPHVCGQTILRVVCQFESFFIGVERCDRNDRTEDFFLEDAGIWCNIGEDGWLQEVSCWGVLRTVTDE